MDNETYQALQNVLKQARYLMNEKYAGRRRLPIDQIREVSILIRDIQTVRNWIDECKEDIERDIEFDQVHK